MQENKSDQLITILVVPISWIVALITSIILWTCQLDWVYYLIGVFTGLLNFGLMIKFNRKLVRDAQIDTEYAQIHARKHAWMGLLTRIIVFLGVFLAIFFKEVYNNPSGIWNLVIAFSGYATVKIVLIAVYLIFRKKVNS